MRPAMSAGRHKYTTLVTLALLATSASAVNSTDLINALLPGSDAAVNSNLITGEAKDLGSLTLTVLSNASHALISFNTSVVPGWLAVGFGNAMSDSAMVIAYPTTPGEPSGEWTLSPRVAHGHSTPFVTNSSAAADSSYSQLSFLPAVSSSTANSTIISFVRPLEYPNAGQQVWTENDRYLQLVDRGEAKQITWAWGEAPPSGGSLTESIGMHGFDAFGATRFNLSRVFMAGEVEDVPWRWVGPSSVPGGVLLLHVVLALVTWVAVSPFAVLLHRLGKNGLPGVLPWHSRLQKFWTLPATAGAVALGLLASPHSVAHPTLHKLCGLLLLSLLALQVILALISTSTPGSIRFKAVDLADADAKQMWMKQAHAFLGLAILGLGFLQVWTGWKELNEGEPDREDKSWGVLGGSVGWVGVAFVGPYLLVPRVVPRVVGRRREVLPTTAEGEEDGEEMSGGGRGLPLLERGGGAAESRYDVGEGGEFELGSDGEEVASGEEGDGEVVRRPSGDEKGAWRRV